MIPERLAVAAGAGLGAGICCASIAGILGAFQPSEPEPTRESPLLDGVGKAWTRDVEGTPTRILVEHGVPLDGAGAFTGSDSEQGVARLETRPDVLAVQIWEGDGLTGQGAVLRFGPERKDAYARAYSYGDAGPSTRTWSWLEGRLQFGAWPLQPGAIVAFEFNGQVGDAGQSFAGKFVVPASGGHEDSGRARVPRIRVIANTSMDGTPSPSATRAPGINATIERIPARPEVRAFRYMEFDQFGGVQATFCFGPGPDEVQVRVDDLSDAGAPEPWSELHGTIWLSPTPLDQPGSVVELELFGVHAGGPRRFAAKSLTPP